MKRALGVSCAVACLLWACADYQQETQGTTTTASSSSTSSGGAQCSQGLADCNGNGTCETTLGTLDDCGACGDACSTDNSNTTCEAGKCKLACTPDHADCNGLAHDGCEADLTADPNNCGACGTSCGPWGDCFMGTCADILASATSVDAVVLSDASGQTVYFSTFDEFGGDNGEVASVPGGGGTVEPLVTHEHQPARLVWNGEALVWSEAFTRGIFRLSPSAGSAELVYQPVDSTVTPTLLDADEGFAYFTTGTDIQAVAFTGGVASVISTGFTSLSSGRRYGTDLYVTDLGPPIQQTQGGVTYQGHPLGAILRQPLSSGAAVPLVQQLDTPVALAFAGSSMFWVEAGSLTTYAIGTNPEVNIGTLGRIGTSGLDGTGQATLADQLVQPGSVAVDATDVYWTNGGTVGGSNPSGTVYESDGSVMRVPLGGGSPEVLLPSIDAYHVALSDDAVFFSSSNYALVLKTDKPAH